MGVLKESDTLFCEAVYKLLREIKAAIIAYKTFREKFKNRFELAKIDNLPDIKLPGRCFNNF